jgi:hypothetical protein
VPLVHTGWRSAGRALTGASHRPTASKRLAARAIDYMLPSL